MEVKNPSFEIPGLSWGQAEDWTESYDQGAEDIATFFNGTRFTPIEAFEGEWDNNQAAQSVFGLGDLEAALFEGGYAPQESFETSWIEPQTALGGGIWNHHSAWAFTAGMLSSAMFDSVPEAFEDFEEEWDDNEFSKTGYQPIVASGGTVTWGMFDVGVPEGAEDFEEEWDSNQNSKTGYAPIVAGGGTLSWAVFTGPVGAETFESGWTRRFARRAGDYKIGG